MKRYLGVFGHTAVDIILQTDDLPEPNTSAAVINRNTRSGGTAANIAKNSADLGVDTSLASFVGEDFPKDYEESLLKSGVDLKDLKKVPGERTPTCWIISDPEENQMAVIDQGAMEHAEEYDVQEYTIKNCELIHIGTGRPGYYKKVAKKAVDLGKKIAFDPAQELKYVYEQDTFKEILSMSDIFFCNDGESKFAMDYLEVEDIESILGWVDVVIVTHGKEGSTLYTHDLVRNIPAFKPEVVMDPTGAGDSYRAGFYGGLSRGYSLVDCCFIASARASFALESHGPQEKKVDWGSVKKRLEKEGHGIIN